MQDKFSNLMNSLKILNNKLELSWLGQAQLKLGLDLNSINLNEISFIVLVELTNFHFYTYLIHLEIDSHS